METVQDILDAKGSGVIGVSPETTLYEALAVMADRNVGALLVVDRAGEVLGIFTERDFARKFIIKGRTGETTTVKELMTSHVLYVQPATSISDCMNLMTEKRIRHLPVVVNGKAIGLVSIGDVVKAVLETQEKLISQQAFEIGQLERYISGGP